MKTNRTMKLTGMLLLGVLLASACTQSYSQTPLGTPTLIPTGLFVSPFPSGQDPLKIISDIGTQTASAQTAEAGGSPAAGTPAAPSTGSAGTAVTAAATTETPGTSGTAATSGAVTLLPVTVIPGGSTFTATTQSAGTVVVPTFSGTAVPVNRPASYTLQSGEFPYCIARRFNLNPEDLLSLNGISDGSLFYPGRTLTIPQTGTWPGDRALHPHPATYTVSTAGTTVYGVACYYGDVDPQAIATANNISASSVLTVGKTLTIP